MAIFFNIGMTKSAPKPRGRKSYWPTKESFITVGFRIPQSVHDELQKRAQSNFRSMNAELVWTLAKQFGVETQGS